MITLTISILFLIASCDDSNSGPCDNGEHVSIIGQDGTEWICGNTTIMHTENGDTLRITNDKLMVDFYRQYFPNQPWPDDSVNVIVSTEELPPDDTCYEYSKKVTCIALENSN